MNDYMPPNSIDAEKSVLGAMLQDSGAVTLALGELTEDDFYSPEHKSVFNSVLALYDKRSAVDIMTVSDELTREESLSLVGGSAYLLSLCRFTPTTANAGQYVKIVKEKSKLRRIIKQCEATKEACFQQMQDVEEITEDMREALRSLDETDDRLISLPEVLSNTYDYYDRRFKNGVTGIMTGIPPLDYFMGGLKGGEVTIIGARPSVGKSIVAQIIAINASRENYIYFDSHEMQQEQIGTRVFANDTGIPMSDLNGEIGEEQWGYLVESMERLAKRHVLFDFSFPTVEKIRSKCQKLYDQGKLNLVIIDYLQLLQTTKRYDNRNLELGAISRTLKEIALTLKIPVVAVAQLNRESAKAKRPPTMADFRDSGCIEQDADNIILLHEPEGKDVPEDDVTVAANLIADGNRYVLAMFEKQRNGARGSCGLAFRPNLMQITGIDRRA